MSVPVRSVMTRYNYVLVDISRILNVNKLTTYRKADTKRIHCCRTRIHSQCSNPTECRSSTASLMVPARYLSQGAQEAEGELITMDCYKGLPRITLPLPSRKEKCRFILKPISDTVGNLSAMIKEEDRGIDRVLVSSTDRVKIASTCSIELLLEEEEFYIDINDNRYRVSVPTVLLKSFAKNDLEKLSDVRMLVSQLYETLHVTEYHVHKEQTLRTKLEEIQSTLQPLEDRRMQLEKRAEFRTSVLTWVGLGMMGVQFGILARLTWWEYSWDIMEPVTYFVTYGTAMGMYAYFAVTRQDYILPDIRDRQYLITLHKKAHKSGFDVQQYNTLKQQLNNLQADLERLKDPMKHSYSMGSTDCCTPATIENQLTNSCKSSPLESAKRYITFLTNKMKKS